MNFRVLLSKGLGATNYLMLAPISDSFGTLTENPKSSLLTGKLGVTKRS